MLKYCLSLELREHTNMFPRACFVYGEVHNAVITVNVNDVQLNKFPLSCLMVF